MFTGIITHIGKLQSISGTKYTFNADPSFFSKLDQGASVAINGICLTLIAVPKEKSFSIEIMPETKKRTMIGNLKIGDSVNLELPMSASSLFAGHIVQGHVDGIGEIISIETQNDSHIITINAEPGLTRYMINKGSITVNGISLTIIEANDISFTVGIIPYTWGHTMLHFAGIGDAVNLEVDVLAKYIEKLWKK